ncbi:MAG TPA: S9 family peptidase [Anaerolineae bacterium]|nr:S9 family peptidase [Anaerolineae bacterium]
MPARKKRLMTAEDLYRFELITDNRISPDGRHVVFSVQRVDREAEKRYTNLWVAPTSGGALRRFTIGDHTDGQPRWSPDGKTIAFVSNRGDPKQPQIHLIPFDGGEARKLTDLQGDIGAFDWAPDGRRLVVQFRKKDKEDVAREKDEQKKKLGVVSRHVTRVFFKLDGEGYLPKERWHIWTVDAHSGRARQLTDGAVHDETEPCWSPDGKSIAFMSNRSDDPDLNPDAIDLFVVPAAGGRMRKIDAPFGPKAQPGFSPDGRTIAYYGHEGRAVGWKNTSLWIVPANGRGKARNLTAPYDIHVDAWTINDMGQPPLMPPTWSSDGQTIHFQVTLHGNTELRSITLDGDMQTVIGEKGVVGAYSFDQAQSKLACFFGTMTDPGQVQARDMATGATRTLTRVNRALLRSIDLGRVEEVWFKGGAGNDVQGWILTPPDFNPKKKYPSILYIHGGPLVQYGNFLMHEFYYLAAHGYVVYFSNPRGGRGYGEEHAKAIWNAWGSADYDDLMAWADTLAKKPYIDRQRMGVTGGSYGGYMTNWIIGHTDRFMAAVTQRSVSNMISMYGSSDFNWAFQEELGDQPPWDNVENYWERSPMKYIGNARTPTLVLHNEQDLRCAIEQGEQVFVALKKLGVETEMVRFPDEPHGLSRVGRTDRRIERLHRIRGWFDRYLKGNGK